MHHQNSVFHDLLKLIDWPSFERLVAESGGGGRARSFTSRNHLVALLFSQFEGSQSLRAVEATMASHRARLYGDAGRGLPVVPGSGVLSGRIGFLPGRQARSRKNPMQDAVREVTVMTDTGKQLRILSNGLDAPAREIAGLYKRRWQIELYFRLIEQTLRIAHFMGRSENALALQIAVASIAYLVPHMLQQITKVKHGFLELVRLVRSNLMHRKSAANLREIQRPPRQDSRQLDLNWTTS